MLTGGVPHVRRSIGYKRFGKKAQPIEKYDSEFLNFKYTPLTARNALLSVS